MHIPKPTIGPFEINFNTILNITTLVSLIGGGGFLWANTSRDISELKASSVRFEERFRILESEVRKIDNLSYRITLTEQSTTSTGTAIKELQGVLSQQSGDLKVVREILQRLEAAQRTR